MDLYNEVRMVLGISTLQDGGSGSEFGAGLGSKVGSGFRLDGEDNPTSNPTPAPGVSGPSKGVSLTLFASRFVAWCAGVPAPLRIVEPPTLNLAPPPTHTPIPSSNPSTSCLMDALAVSGMRAGQHLILPTT